MTTRICLTVQLKISIAGKSIFRSLCLHCSRLWHSVLLDLKTKNNASLVTYQVMLIVPSHTPTRQMHVFLNNFTEVTADCMHELAINYTLFTPFTLNNANASSQCCLQENLKLPQMST